jgi:predicted PurR-regulated permease PerM
MKWPDRAQQRRDPERLNGVSKDSRAPDPVVAARRGGPVRASSRPDWSLAQLVTAAAIVAAVFVITLTLLRLAQLWILLFGSVIVAVILRAIVDPLVARLRIKDGLAVLIAVTTLVALAVAAAVFFGGQIVGQATTLSEELPQRWATLQQRLQQSAHGAAVIGQLGELAPQAGQWIDRMPRLVMGTLSGVTTFVLVMVAGVFLALRPAESRDGLLSLFPIERRPRLREVMDTCGAALKGWLRAQLISMVLMGVMVGLGLWLIGVPSPLALGLLTGLAEFVPLVGAIASAVPGLILASTAGLHVFGLALALYIVAHQIEANLIMPLVQRNVAALPVVLGIFAVVAFGTLFGPLGVVFAVPLALVIHTLVSMLYRRDVLHDQAATVPGELRVRPARTVR